MERRVLLAVFLSFLVLMVYQTFVVKPRTKPGASSAPPAPSATPSSGGSTATAPSPAPEVEAAAPTPPAPAVSVGGSRELEIVVDTDTVRAVFSNRGAVLKSWLLKQYLDSRGRPLDLVPPAITDVSRLPFSISLADATLTSRINGAIYQASPETLSLGAQSGTLRFAYQDATGLSVSKTIEIQPGGQAYVLRVATDVRLNGQPVRVATHGGAGFGDIERGVQQGGFLAVSTYQPPQSIFQMGGDVSRIRPDKIGEQPAHEGLMRYAGVDDQYFLAAVVSGGKQTRVEYQPLTITTAAGERAIVDYHVRVAGDDPLTFFYGPKEFDRLQRVDAELVRTIHFGIFGFLATPLLKSLKWVNASIGNYGWSIILLTIIINLLMFPLRHKSAVSMRKMQQIQPQVKAIQDRYAKLKATDPARQKMNTELMNLYRERGVNPASGCVPMLLTFPVLFAFYALLSVAIELRGAPWVGWIQDLSTHDPYYVTPILMGISQFWQTRLMPATGDPAQQRVMMLMPLMFMVFFLWAPSGLVLYWLVSNVWTIGQQYLTNYLIAGKPAARAAAR